MERYIRLMVKLAILLAVAGTVLMYATPVVDWWWALSNDEQRAYTAVALTLVVSAKFADALFLFGRRTHQVVAAPVSRALLSTGPALAAARTMRDALPVNPEVAAILKRVCDHEAAHAVVGFQFGSVPVKVWASPNTLNGQCSSRRMEGLEPHEGAWADLVQAVAGHVMDRRAGVRDHGSCEDIRSALAYAAEILSIGTPPVGFPADTELTSDALVKAATVRAEELLVKHADAVERVSEALRVHPSHRLEWDALARLLVPPGPGTPPGGDTNPAEGDPSEG